MGPSEIGKVLLVIGTAIAFLGLAFMLAGKFHISWMGRLPGDFFFQGKNFSFYFPLTTGLLISIILSVILWLITRK